MCLAFHKNSINYIYKVDWREIAAQTVRLRAAANKTLTIVFSISLRFQCADAWPQLF